MPTLSPAGVLWGGWHCVLEAAIHSSGRCQGLVPTGRQVPSTRGDARLCPREGTRLSGWCQPDARVCAGGWRPPCRGRPEPPALTGALSPQISFFSLLSVLCVMLSMAGSVLSCKNAQLARDFRDCSMVRCEGGEPGRPGWGVCGTPGSVLTPAASPSPRPPGRKGLRVLPPGSPPPALSRLRAGTESRPELHLR